MLISKKKLNVFQKLYPYFHSVITFCNYAIKTIYLGMQYNFVCNAVVKFSITSTECSFSKSLQSEM